MLKKSESGNTTHKTSYSNRNDRNLNPSDLGKSDVLCFQNGPVSPVEGWELLEVGFSGLLYQSGSDAIVEGPSVMLDGVLIVVVEADTIIDSIVGIRRSQEDYCHCRVS